MKTHHNHHRQWRSTYVYHWESNQPWGSSCILEAFMARIFRVHSLLVPINVSYLIQVTLLENFVPSGGWRQHVACDSTRGFRRPRLRGGWSRSGSCAWSWRLLTRRWRRSRPIEPPCRVHVAVPLLSLAPFMSRFIHANYSYRQTLLIVKFLL